MSNKKYTRKGYRKVYGKKYTRKGGEGSFKVAARQTAQGINGMSNSVKKGMKKTAQNTITGTRKNAVKIMDHAKKGVKNTVTGTKKIAVKANEGVKNMGKNMGNVIINTAVKASDATQRGIDIGNKKAKEATESLGRHYHAAMIMNPASNEYTEYVKKFNNSVQQLRNIVSGLYRLHNIPQKGGNLITNALDNRFTGKKHLNFVDNKREAIKLVQLLNDYIFSNTDQGRIDLIIKYFEANPMIINADHEEQGEKDTDSQDTDSQDTYSQDTYSQDTYSQDTVSQDTDPQDTDSQETEGVTKEVTPPIQISRI